MLLLNMYFTDLQPRSWRLNLSYNPTNINNQQQPRRQIGPYELRELIGKGGMSQVYKAYQASLDRFVAIKLLSTKLATDPLFIERFRREARSIARLRHPNIIAIHDFGEENGVYFLVMELIEGRTLRDEMDKGLLPPGRLIEILEQIGSALEIAHRNNIIHRDIKPNNILLDGPQRAVLSDFGIAKELDRNTVLTQTGYGVGTPEYMFPEQALGQTLDPRSDQYSLAVVVYEIMTGRTPFKADSAVAILAAHINTPPPSARQFNPHISQAVESILMRALSKDPRQRFNSISDMVRALGQELKPDGGDQSRTRIGGTVSPNFPSSPVSSPKSGSPTSFGNPKMAEPVHNQQKVLNNSTIPASPPVNAVTSIAGSLPPQVIPPPPSYATAMPLINSSDQLFGYKGFPGSIAIPKGPVGELPPPLKKRGTGCLLILFLILLVLLVIMIIALVVWHPWQKSTSEALSILLLLSFGYLRI